MKQAKVVIQQRIVPHYRVPVLNELIKRLTDIVVLYGNHRLGESIRNASISDDVHYKKLRCFYPLKGKKFYLCNMISVLFKLRPDVVVFSHELGNLNFYVLLFLRPFLRFRLVGWTHGWNRTRGFHPDKSLIDRFRIACMRSFNAVILYSEDAYKVLKGYLEPEMLFVAKNTLDTIELVRIRERLASEGREYVKRRIGFYHRYNLVFIGRLLEAKEPDRLIDVFCIVRKHIPDICLHFVGDGPMRCELDTKATSLGVKEVVFHRSVFDKQAAGEILYASDLMVMPACLGLSVNHAFCFECPVVSQIEPSDNTFHGPEVEYVIDGKTGFLVPYHDNKAMANTIVAYLNDEEMQACMRSDVLYMMKKEVTLHNMVQGLIDAIEFACK